MKKISLTILLCGIIILSVTGCGKKSQEPDKKETADYDKELVQCLENELSSHLVTENDSLIEIPLSEIKNKDKEKFAYYKGMYASNHPENKYVIVFPKNGTYDFYVMKDFDKYFYEQFPIYQEGDISSVTFYIHTPENDIDFEDIANKCIVSDNSKDSKSIPTKILNKLNNTTKVVVKSFNSELGTITDKNKLSEILNAISGSRQYGEAFLCDGNGFEFEMYDNDNKLIDTIYVWGDGKRLIPSSIHDGCSYYSTSNSIDLRKIIEDGTDYVFYSLLDFRDNENQKQQLIYKDDKNSFYLKSENTNEVLVRFMLNNKTMSLKYALENKYISIEKVVSKYPELLIKQ